MSATKCPSCGAPLGENISACKYCGEKIIAVQAQPQYNNNFNTQNEPHPYQQTAASHQSNGFAPVPPVYGAQPTYYKGKSKIAAGLLGIFLGGFGIHKFYLGRIGWGIVYLLFCWTYIPAIVGFIEGIVYLFSNEERFQQKYRR